MVVVAGWLTDKVGQKKVMAFSLLLAALLTMMLSFTKGWVLLLVLFFQAAVLTSFFPAGFAALSRVAEPSLRSVTSAVGPPLAFLVGAGLVPAAIGYVAESYSFATGIFLAGTFMLFGPALVLCLKLGDYDGQAGC
jgi:NNP family nitrate/nitrite transporter-like MFS transporter